jgi:hypothetical protein
MTVAGTARAAARNTRRAPDLGLIFGIGFSPEKGDTALEIPILTAP